MSTTPLFDFSHTPPSAVGSGAPSSGVNTIYYVFHRPSMLIEENLNIDDGGVPSQGLTTGLDLKNSIATHAGVNPAAFDMHLPPRHPKIRSDMNPEAASMLPLRTNLADLNLGWPTDKAGRLAPVIIKVNSLLPAAAPPSASPSASPSSQLRRFDLIEFAHWGETQLRNMLLTDLPRATDRMAISDFINEWQIVSKRVKIVESIFRTKLPPLPVARTEKTLHRKIQPELLVDATFYCEPTYCKHLDFLGSGQEDTSTTPRSEHGGAILLHPLLDALHDCGRVLGMCLSKVYDITSASSVIKARTRPDFLVYDCDRLVCVGEEKHADANEAWTDLVNKIHPDSSDMPSILPIIATSSKVVLFGFVLPQSAAAVAQADMEGSKSQFFHTLSTHKRNRTFETLINFFRYVAALVRLIYVSDLINSHSTEQQSQPSSSTSVTQQTPQMATESTPSPNSTACQLGIPSYFTKNNNITPIDGGVQKKLTIGPYDQETMMAFTNLYLTLNTLQGTARRFNCLPRCKGPQFSVPLETSARSSSPKSDRSKDDVIMTIEVFPRGEMRMPKNVDELKDAIRAVLTALYLFHNHVGFAHTDIRWPNVLYVPEMVIAPTGAMDIETTAEMTMETTAEMTMETTAEMTMETTAEMTMETTAGVAAATTVEKAHWMLIDFENAVRDQKEFGMDYFKVGALMTYFIEWLDDDAIELMDFLHRRQDYSALRSFYWVGNLDLGTF